MSLPLSQASIVQFGTSRFLLGHVAAFAGAAIDEGRSQASILVVQTSTRPAGKTRAAALAKQTRYPLHIRGLLDGKRVDQVLEVGSVSSALVAEDEWLALEQHFIYTARWVVSNTGDSGYQLGDDSSLLPVPASFPGKLTKLLHSRYNAGRPGLTLLPCELVSGNGQVLKGLVAGLAHKDYQDAGFERWLENDCCWVDSLVDRIVSAPLEPVGAVAEPYALWAVKQTPGLVMPFEHPAIELVHSLAPYELRKLHILNLAHTYLVDQWQHYELASSITCVREALQSSLLRQSLCEVIESEVLPVLSLEMPGEDLDAYWASTLERFDNPYLDHRLSDIAHYHADKLERRIRPVVEMARRHGVPAVRLTKALERFEAYHTS